MTLRERIADWISGGALTKAWKDRDIWQGYFEAAHRADKAKRIELREAYEGWRRAAYRLDSIAADRLNRIAAQETPKANATVRRICRIARGEE